MKNARLTFNGTYVKLAVLYFIKVLSYINSSVFPEYFVILKRRIGLT
jgi:hypothetical protein